MFKVTLKKMSYLVALMIAFLISLAAPVAAMADVGTGWSAHSQSYELSAIRAEPVSLNLSGEKDTVLGVYDVLPLIGGNAPSGKLADKSTVKTDSIAIFARYKDRPGWRM